uniref:Uncharacterized protein n=1 Tax=Poecilia formosa TaxID=48698 RepID=A0A096M074_POEFO
FGLRQPLNAPRSSPNLRITNMGSCHISNLILCRDLVKCKMCLYKLLYKRREKICYVF